MSGPGLSIVGQDATHAPPPTGPVIWQTAFRPFFWLAALAALSLVPAWLGALTGAWSLRPALDPLAWHAHEMIFGFALAVVAGFLLTAAMVWTGHVTLRGRALAALALWWVLGRILLLAGSDALLAAAVVNATFPLAVAGGIAGPIIKARSTRNVPFLILLPVMAGAQAALFGEALGAWSGLRSASLWVGLYAVGIMVVVVGGRIVPMFTKNATGAEIRERNVVDRLAPWSVALVMALHAGGAPPRFIAGATFAAGVVNVVRMYGWGGSSSLAQPFVAVLHAGYGALSLGFLLEGAAGFTDLAAAHPGRHLIAVGGVGIICLGMMTRVALGHTGRPLHPPRGTTALYAGLVGAALLRVVATLQPAATTPLLWAAGGLFALSFVGYLVLYGRILLVPRADGKPG